MQKKNLIIIGLVSLTLLAGGAFTYQLSSNNSLKSELAQSQEEANSKISNLEKELNKMKEVLKTPSFTTDFGEKAKVEQTAQFMKEEDLLANFFAVPPTMITTESDEQPSTGETKSGPSLLVTPEVFDLGQISKANGLATATFTLKNDGDKPLTITYAFSSCGCTVAPLKDEKILQPGESFPLEVTYDPNFYGPKYELGPIEKTVTILSNYIVKPFYKVKLKANVVP